MFENVQDNLRQAPRVLGLRKECDWSMLSSADDILVYIGTGLSRLSSHSLMKCLLIIIVPA